MIFGNYGKRLKEDTKVLVEFSKRVSRPIYCKAKCSIKLTKKSKSIIGVVLEDACGDELYVKYSVIEKFFNEGYVGITTNSNQALPINYIRIVANSKA